MEEKKEKLAPAAGNGALLIITTTFSIKTKGSRWCERPRVGRSRQFVQAVCQKLETEVMSARKKEL